MSIDPTEPAPPSPLPPSRPQDMKVTASGMGVWLLSFVVTGLVVAPRLGLLLFGKPFADMSSTDQAIYGAPSGRAP